MSVALESDLPTPVFPRWHVCVEAKCERKIESLRKKKRRTKDYAF